MSERDSSTRVSTEESETRDTTRRTGVSLPPDGVGRWLCVGASSPTIAAGELVMLLPPNMLLWEEEVTDMNTCLQLCTTASGARLFSSSLTEFDLDNLICHSCDPNCEARRTA